MSKLLCAAAALAAAFAQPALATTFPTLTTIYVGSGVTDDGGATHTGVATVFNCSNVSGVPSTIRFLVLNAIGAVEGQIHFQSVPHGFTVTVATHAVTTFDANSFSTGTVNHGVVNIEATQSGVFCTAFIVDAADDADMAQLHLVRINGHPGAEE